MVFDICKDAKAQKGSDVVTPPKKRYHALRLVMEAEQIGSGKGPRVWFPDGPERDLIMRFRNGEGTQEEFIAAYSSAAEKAAVLATNLPETTNVDPLEPLLVKCRREFLQIPSDAKGFNDVVGPESGNLMLRDQLSIFFFFFFCVVSYSFDFGLFVL